MEPNSLQTIVENTCLHSFRKHWYTPLFPNNKKLTSYRWLVAGDYEFVQTSQVL